MSAPAGWYPDSSGTPRYWDGVRWVDSMPSAPQAYNRPPQRVATGTPAGTLWIWLIVLVPIVAGIASTIYLGQLTTNLGGLVGAITAQDSASDPRAIVQWEMTAVFSPWYFALLLLGLATYGVSVWFGYRDVRELEARGFDRPFPWPWLFLSPWVYVIGRTVVISRRGGRGFAPLVVFLVIQALSLVAGMVWFFGFTSELMHAIVMQVPTT